MKNLVFLLLLVFSSIVFSQTERYTGTYIMYHVINTEGSLEYTLELLSNGTFTFHNYRKITVKNPEENQYGKGTWKIEKNNVLYFYTDQENDLDDKHILDFNNTKARYVTKNPRNKSDKEVKTNLRFYNSEIPWIKGVTLYKN